MSYSNLDKILHRQLLGDTDVSRFLYKRLLNDKSALTYSPIGVRNVFITGLARSGTTALLNNLHSSKEFASLYYKYLPFFLSPKAVAVLFRDRKSFENRTFSRAHGDGLLISQDSPECIDEVFWIKAKVGINSDKPTSIPENILRAYGALLARYAKIENMTRMLVKNNNHHVRLPQLASYFSDSIFLVCFRDPFAQALSLLSQHLRFLEIQSSDPFVLEYMNFLGHHEFGLGMLPFGYEDKYRLKCYSPNFIDYWISRWICTYSWLLGQIEKGCLPNVVLVCYEMLCNSDSYRMNLMDHLMVNLPVDSASEFVCSNNVNDLPPVNKLLGEKASEIYSLLLARAVI